MNPTLPTRSSRRRRERGSVLVTCMVLAALGTIGVAAWFSLVDARGHQIEANLNGIQRNFIHDNSRALASRALCANHLHTNSAPLEDTVYILPDGLGQATVRAYGTIPLKSPDRGLYGKTGATPFESYAVEVAVDLHDGKSDHRWTFRLRSSNPALAGDLLSLHPPADSTDPAALVSGDLRVKGRAVFWDAATVDLSSGIKADEFLLPGKLNAATTFVSSAGNATLPLNYPHYRRTIGVFSGGASYNGELELLSASINPQNSYEERINASGGIATKIKGNEKKSENKDPKNKKDKDDDAALLEMIENSSPDQVANELSQDDSLSSTVLVASVQKSNPPLKNRNLLTVFDAQNQIPEDALTEVMASIDEDDYSDALDMAFIEMNDKNGTYYNANGNGMVQIFLDRTDLTHVVLEGVTRLRLFGQPTTARANAAGALPPLLIIVNNTAGQTLQRLELFHGNNRPVILAMASAPTSPASPTVVFKGNNAFPLWRLLFDLQHTGLSIDGSGTAGVKFVGGIRGNHRIAVTSGSVILERDTSPDTLLPLASRDAWIEAHRH